MRIHGSRDLAVDVWADPPALQRDSAERVQIRLGVNRYSTTADEATRFAAALLAAAEKVKGNLP